jgi:hypothetical protein
MRGLLQQEIERRYDCHLSSTWTRLTGGEEVIQKWELAFAIPFIRWRLREETRYALAAAERGESWDREYTEQEIRAFQRLRGRQL